MLTLCCLSLTLMSLAISDFDQTARFTGATGRYEINPIMAPVMNGPGSQWEVALASGEIVLILLLEEHDRPWVHGLRWVGLIGHGLAVLNNNSLGFKPPVIVFPVIEIRW